MTGDLVVLDATPLDDITNIQKITGPRPYPASRGPNASGATKYSGPKSDATSLVNRPQAFNLSADLNRAALVSAEEKILSREIFSSAKPVA
jgi:hypothetical protein